MLLFTIAVAVVTSVVVTVAGATIVVVTVGGPNRNKSQQ